MNYLGDFLAGETIYIYFNTFDGNGASTTVTDLANTDIHIHKDGGLTQRTSSSGVTIYIDFDGITGCHLITIDTSDNTDAGFYSTGSDFQVRLEGITVDTQTLNPWIGSFSIQNRFMRGTDSALLASSAPTNFGDLTITPTTGRVDINTNNDKTGYSISGTLTTLDSLENVSQAEVQSACDTAITSNTDINNIDTGVNNIEAKLPTNYIMGSSDQTDKDDDIDAILEDTGTTIPAQITALNDITVADIVAGITDGSYDLEEMLRLIVSAVAGQSSGGGTTTAYFRDLADGKNRITATIDSNGNRTGVTYDVTD
jgi:hypothetical protein